MKPTPIRIVRRSSLKFRVIVKDADGVPVSLTGATVYFGVDKVAGDASNLILLTNGAQVVIPAQTGDDTGAVDITLVPTETQGSTTPPGLYAYEVRVVFVGGFVAVPKRGPFIIDAEVISLP